MRTVVCLALVVVLAGCTARPPAVEETPETPSLQTETVPWAIDDIVSRSGGCITPPGFCFGGHDDQWPTFAVQANQRVDGFSLTLETNAGFTNRGTDPVNIKVWCIEAESPCLGNATVEARSTLPATVEASGLGWPLGASLGIRFERDQDLARYPEPAEPIHLHGDVVVVLDPTIMPPVLKEERTDFAYDTVTGVCAMLVEPDCYSGPWRTIDLPPAQGRVVRVVGNATWDAATPASSTMRFSVTCYNTGSDCTDERFVKQGPSPLAIDTGDLRDMPLQEGIHLQMHIEETGAEPYPTITPLTRQPFHLEGTIVSLVAVVED